MRFRNPLPGTFLPGLPFQRRRGGARAPPLRQEPGAQSGRGVGLMDLGTILLIILILLLIGAVPSWPYSRGWGYGPSGIVGVILIIVIIWLLMRAA